MPRKDGMPRSPEAFANQHRPRLTRSQHNQLMGAWNGLSGDERSEAIRSLAQEFGISNNEVKRIIWSTLKGRS